MKVAAGVEPTGAYRWIHIYEFDGDQAVTVPVGWFDEGRDRRFGAMTVAATVFRLPRLALRPRGGGWLPRQSRERPGWDGRVCRSRASASGLPDPLPSRERCG